MPVFDRTSSLRKRSLFAAFIVLLLFFSLAGFVLQRSFANSVEQNASSTLQAYVVALLSSLEFESDDTVVFETLPLPALAQPNSGIYAEIWQRDQLLWRSDSMIGRALPTVAADLAVYRFFAMPDKENKYLLSLLVDWQEEQVDRQFKLVVAVDADPYRQQLQGYTRTLLFWLFGLGLLLLVLQMALLVWQYQPLARVIRQLHSIQSGQRSRFDDDFPREVNALTHSLNQFIEHEKKQIERLRDSFANLAHSLKTPLAVIKGQLPQEGAESQLIEQQLAQMTDSIEYQLNKASTLARRRFQAPIACEQPIKRIVDALRTLYADRDIDIILEVAADSVFAGEEGDLLELVGNLLENACKWSHKAVILKVANVAADVQTQSTQRPLLQIEVIDDGPGIDASQRDEILQRGRRLDERVKGHGIGLSIVTDIVAAYEGKLQLTDACGFKPDWSSGLHVTILL